MESMGLEGITGRKTFTVEECARALGIGRATAYEGCKTGAIPSIRLGRRILVPRKALERLLEGPEHHGDAGGDQAQQER